ncbi:MAG: YbjN domain-containing protein [Methylovirgula sp.]|nr:YbjN domain-containing protein [Methylovirgula sp.]
MSLSQIELPQAETENPVDQIEKIATHHQWSFDRDDEDEISIAVTGTWTDYNIAFTWLSDMEALHVACAFDLKVPPARRSDALALIALINEQLWIGHFDVWPQDGVVMFRHSILLTGGAVLNVSQCEAALSNAVTACERYYQAFQFVVWAGKGGREALETALLETKGEA